MSTDKDLTIVLAIKDRAPFTLRWMSYANQVKLPFKVLIADGGKDETVTEVLSKRANFPEVDYEYLRYPYDETYHHYYAKLVDATRRVQTPFVIHADDDDFLIADGLRRSVDFLRDHADYSSCRGNIGGVNIQSSTKYGEFCNVYGGEIKFVRQVYADKSALEATAVERMHNYFACYRATWYDVFRTSQSIENFQTLLDLNTKDLILCQHIPMLMGVVAGKVHVDSYLYLVRQVDSPYNSTEAETQKKGDDFDRMLLETWSEDFNGFVNAIAAAVSKKDGISLEEARREVKRGYRTLVTPGIIRCLLESAPTRSDQLSRRLNSYMGTDSSLLRKLYRAIQKLRGGRSQGIERQYLTAAQLSASDVDFKFIYDFLSAPPPSIEAWQPEAQVRNSFEYSST